jgi:hypothetical protein
LLELRRQIFSSAQVGADAGAPVNTIIAPISFLN